MKIIQEFRLIKGQAVMSDVCRYGPFEDPEAVLLALGALKGQSLSYLSERNFTDRPGDWEDAWAIPNPNLEQELTEWAKRNKVEITVKDGKVFYEDGLFKSVNEYICDVGVPVYKFSRVFEIINLQSDILAHSPFSDIPSPLASNDSATTRDRDLLRVLFPMGRDV